jgi:nucleoside-diphosphate-sugar epimerase
MAREGWAYLDVRDAARAILLAVTSPLRGVHVVGLSARDTLLSEPTGELLVRFAPDTPVTRPLSGREALVDTTAVKSLLGFEPMFSLHDGRPLAGASSQPVGKGASDGEDNSDRHLRT